MSGIIFIHLVGWAVTCGAEPDRIDAPEMSDGDLLEADVRWVLWRLSLLLWWPFRLGRLLRHLP